jgi:hypothetical protein
MLWIVESALRQAHLFETGKSQQNVVSHINISVILGQRTLGRKLLDHGRRKEKYFNL